MPRNKNTQIYCYWLRQFSKSKKKKKREGFILNKVDIQMKVIHME